MFYINLHDLDIYKDKLLTQPPDVNNAGWTTSDIFKDKFKKEIPIYEI